jgi:hypothetical protein
MIGTLTKKWDKWYIIYNQLNEDGDVAKYELPLHPDECWLDTCDGNEGTEFEFTITRINKEDASGKRWTEQVAKLHSKVVESIDLWINVYNNAVDDGIDTMPEFVRWLKEHYEPPRKRS